MKKIGVLVVLVILLFLTFTFADNETNTTDSEDSSATTSYSSSSSSDVETLGNLSKAFDCLEEKAGEDCKNVDTVHELSLIILSTPENIMDGCVEKLENKQSNNHFGTIKDTALALLALNHAGVDTELIEKWLLEQRLNPDDIIWYLQQDSEGAVGCKVDDGDVSYDIEINENKKINKDAGTCLERAMSNFWYEIDPKCYSKLFKISCDQEFITNLLYKHKRSSTIYVLEDTKQSPAFGVTEHLVNSKCLGTSGVCDYEGTAWGAYALSVTDNEVSEFVPYLISSGDLKKMYLPNAFIYLVTGYENYGTRLIQEQRFGTYWEAESTVYNRYYDTALALLSLGITQEQTTAAKNWLLYEQGANGCWANSVRETAFILWVLLKKSYYVDTTASTVYCDEAGFYCVDKTMCSEENDVGDNYYCSGISKTCCKVLELDSCLEMGGGICPEDQVCRGLETQASDTENCCLAGCKAAEETTTECEAASYDNVCYSGTSCAEGYTELSLNCNSGMICCQKTLEEESSGLPWWIWFLIILIIVVIFAIIYFYRDKIKKRFKKDNDEGREVDIRPGMPPRPGMMRRPGMPGRPGMPPRPGMMRRPPMRPRPRMPR